MGGNLKITGSQINKAGEKLKELSAEQKGYLDAKKVFDGWRGGHFYPLRVFRRRLERISKKEDRNSVCSQRLKRIVSVKRKLLRFPKMKLSQMQDVGGCRVVVKDLEIAQKIFEMYTKNGSLKHKRARSDDYVNSPKRDGYRSLHVVYEYKSDKEGKQKYNGLKVEIQIRTLLQHYWAVTVETVGLFTNQGLKFGEGKREWSDFFRLVSSAFALKEKTRAVENTPSEKKVLYSEIKRIEKSLKVIKWLELWNSSIEILTSLNKDKKADAFVLEFDPEMKEVAVRSYKHMEKALEDYSKIESRIRTDSFKDVVLVSVKEFKDLREAYPNYFADTGGFITELRKILRKGN